MQNAECRMKTKLGRLLRFHFAFCILHFAFDRRRICRCLLGESHLVVLSALWGGADCAAGWLKFARWFFRTSAVKQLGGACDRPGGG